MGAMKDYGMGISSLVGEDGDISERVIAIALHVSSESLKRGVPPDPEDPRFQALAREAAELFDAGKLNSL